jgi:hypothetical protein
MDFKALGGYLDSSGPESGPCPWIGYPRPDGTGCPAMKPDCPSFFNVTDKCLDCKTTQTTTAKPKPTPCPPPVASPCAPGAQPAFKQDMTFNTNKLKLKNKAPSNDDCEYRCFKNKNKKCWCVYSEYDAAADECLYFKCIK